jgi:hypothetical protein
MQHSGGIGQHLEHVILLTRGGSGLGAIEFRLLLPALVPLLLDELRVVTLAIARLLGGVQYFSFLLVGRRIDSF